MIGAKKKNKISLTFLVGVMLALVLGGCGTTVNYGTPVVEKHATRGYNKPYQIKGVWYHPQKHYEYSETAVASYYGGTDVFHGRKTSNGETFDMNRLSAAHKTLPIPCVVRVTNLDNGRSLKLKVNDRGPFIDGRIIDVSRKAAKMLGFYEKGTAQVRVETLVSESVAVAKGYKSCPIESHITRAEVEPSPQQEKKIYKKKMAPIQDVLLKKPLRVQTKNFPKREGVQFIRVSEHKTLSGARAAAKNLAEQMQIGTKFEGKGSTYKVILGPIPPSVNLENLLHRIRSQGYRQAVALNKNSH